jgi:PPOX class probable F420-dependent enzyme
MVFDNPDEPRHGRAQSRLDGDRIGWLTTVRPDGQPQTMPIWFIWDAGEVLVFSDHRAQRNRNIAANPRVSFHLDTNPEGGDVVMLEGEARLDPTLVGPQDHPGYVAKYNAWIAAWFSTPEQMAEVYHVAIRIRPTRGVSLANEA